MSSTSTPLPEKKPWPMSWVLLSILAFIVGYTLIMAFFRKQQDPFFPYEEAQSSQIEPLLKSEGWEVFPGPALTGSFREGERFTFSPRSEVELTEQSTESLIDISFEDPPIPLVLDKVLAAPWIREDEPYQAELLWLSKDDFEYPNRLYFYRRGQDIMILPPHGRGREVTSENFRTYLFIAPEHLEPGLYTFHLFGEGKFTSWTVGVGPQHTPENPLP